MKVRTRRTVLLALAAHLLAPGLLLGQRTESRPPERVAADFYRWYLRELAANHDPLTDRNKLLPSYVATPLLREIDRKMHSADGLDRDYFLQAQDYLNDWLKNVATSETVVEGGSARTVVTLGERVESRYRLGVGLVKDAAGWKIRRVARLGR